MYQAYNIYSSSNAAQHWIGCAQFNARNVVVLQAYGCCCCCCWCLLTTPRSCHFIILSWSLHARDTKESQMDKQRGMADRLDDLSQVAPSSHPIPSHPHCQSHFHLPTAKWYSTNDSILVSGKSSAARFHRMKHEIVLSTLKLLLITAGVFFLQN